MNNHYEKKQQLARQTAVIQNLKRMKRGVGAIMKDPAKAAALTACLSGILAAWPARHVLLGYNPEDVLAPLNDLLIGAGLGLTAPAILSAIVWGCGGPLQAGKIQDNLTRSGVVNSVGEAPTLTFIEKDPNNPNAKTYTFFSCGISLADFMNCADKIQTALNMTIADIRYGVDHQHIQLSAVPPMTVFPTDLVWSDQLRPLNLTELLLGLSAIGPVIVDLSKTPHLIIGGATNSGKTVLLKVLLRQCFHHGMKIYIADFKGAVDFCSDWWQTNCTLTYDLDGLVQMLDEFIARLEERKKLFREAGCANITQYNALPGPPLPRMVFATDEAAFVFDKSGRSKEEKELIDKISAKLSVLTSQGRAFGLHVFLATQRPDAQVIPGFVRSNVDFRVCGRADKILSEIVLGSTIADEVIPKTACGRFVLNDGCGNSATVFQAYRLPDRYM